MGCVYVAINRNNGKRYIGKTMISMDHRKKVHAKAAKAGCRYLFYRAIRKHGFEAFDWEVLCESDSESDINVAEMCFIKMFNAKTPLGYNSTDGGEGQTGASEETRAKMSLTHKGKKKSEEHRRNLSIAKTGSKMPAGFGDKMRSINTGSKRTEETKRRMSEKSLGRRHSPESKAKLSAAHMGKIISPETRARMSLAHMGNPGNRGKKLSEEHRMNLSKARIGMKYSDETRAKMSASIRLALAAKKAERIAALERNIEVDRKRTT